MMRKLATLLLGCVVAMGGNNGLAAGGPKLPTISAPTKPEQGSTCGENKERDNLGLATFGATCATGITCSILTGGADLGLCAAALCTLHGFVAYKAGKELADLWGATKCAGLGATYEVDGQPIRWFFWNHNSWESATRALRERVKAKGGRNLQIGVRFDSTIYRCGAAYWGKVNGVSRAFFGRGGTSSAAADQALKYCDAAAEKCYGRFTTCNEWSE